MIHIQWKEQLRIGQPEIDRQHQRLVSIINELIDRINRRSPPGEASSLVHALADYAMSHFRLEERYMMRSHYPGTYRHKHEHEAFVRRVLAYNIDSSEITPELLDDMLSFLKQWLMEHISSRDQDYAPSLRAFAGTAPVAAVVFAAPLAVGGLDIGRLAGRLAAHAALPAEELEAKVLRGTALLADWESGKLDDDGVTAALAAAGGPSLPTAGFLDACRDSFVAREDFLPLLRSLKPPLRLALVADAGPGLMAAAVRPHPAFGLFEACCASYETGAPRHGEATLAGVRRRLDLLAEEMVYVDDDPGARAAAAGEKLRAIAGGPEAVARELHRLGVPIVV